MLPLYLIPPQALLQAHNVDRGWRNANRLSFNKGQARAPLRYPFDLRQRDVLEIDLNAIFIGRLPCRSCTAKKY